MSFYSKIPEKTPQDMWKELEELGGRMIETIPFGSNTEDMEGFICVLGKDQELPVLTFCIANPAKDKCITANIIFNSSEHYNIFIDKLNIDFIKNFVSSQDMN